MNTPQIVSPEQWNAAREELPIREKEHTRARDALAAERRRMRDRTYRVNNRGDEAMDTTWSYLDLTALGRREEWEDSPEGYPQTPPCQWWNLHDEYGDAVAGTQG